MDIPMRLVTFEDYLNYVRKNKKVVVEDAEIKNVGRTFLIYHEHLFVFRKPKKNEKLKDYKFSVKWW